jgi:hypothetical protein
VTRRELVEGLADVMGSVADALMALLPTVRVMTGIMVRVKLRRREVISLVYWFALEWGGCEYYIKAYRKWGPDGVLRPVIGISHVANCGGTLVYYPAIDADGRIPSREYLERAIVVWAYRSAKKGRVAYHLVLPPASTKSAAIRAMLPYDDRKHLKMAHRPRPVDRFDFAVLRVSSYLSWREEVVAARFAGGDPMARLHRALRCWLWTHPSVKRFCG